MRRASLVVLPYREIEQSGVAFTALGAGAPLLLSDVGGFPELAATGAARTFRAGDPAALHAAITELLANPAALVQLAASAGVAAGREYSWERIAQQTLALYAGCSKAERRALGRSVGPEVAAAPRRRRRGGDRTRAASCPPGPPRTRA